MTHPTDMKEFLEQTLECYHDGLKAKVARSYVLQSDDEQKRRLQAVQHLSVELAAIRKKTVFATAIAPTISAIALMPRRTKSEMRRLSCTTLSAPACVWTPRSG